MHLPRHLMLGSIVLATLAPTCVPAADDGARERCDETLASRVDRPTTVRTPCVAHPGDVVIESGYYQNASKVGSTALAAYPSIRVRAGVAHDVEVVVDAPTQYAESGPAGTGLYPRSQAGVGLKWLFRRTPGVAYGVDAELAPPLDRTVPTSTHSLYRSDVAAGLDLSQRASLDGVLGVVAFASDQRREAAALTSGLALRYGLSPVTKLSTELTFRSSGAGGTGQTVGAVFLQHALAPRTIVDIGLGTAFNAAGNAKAHYLAFGVAVRP